MNDLFKALSDPTRRKILELLKDGDLSAGEIAAAFDIGKPSISHHLKELKAAGQPAIIPVRDCKENISLSSLEKVRNIFGLDHRKERQRATEISKRMNVKTPSLETLISSLSGGWRWPRRVGSGTGTAEMRRRV